MTDHGPIEAAQRKHMNAIARLLDDAFNGDQNPKTIGFALLTYRFGEDVKGTGRINYIGNGNRDDVLIALKELIARWEAHDELLAARMADEP